MWLSGRSAQATKSSRYLSACGAPPLPHTSDGCGVIPTSATGWKYDPSAAPGSRPIASNCAATYLTASRPPRVAGARPSSRSSARYFKCASIAAALGANRAGAGAAAGLGSDAVVAHAAAAAATRVTLRDDISTDEITPAYICYYYDETLGDFPYLGLKCGDEFPITRGAVKRGGFVASVSGKRRGKGSSREQSPYAEMCAGIRLVVAE